MPVFFSTDFSCERTVFRFKSVLRKIDFADPSEFVPAVVVIVTMPLTFSIAHGIAFGFIAYAGIKLLAGRPRDVSLAVAVLAVLFVVKFALL